MITLVAKTACQHSFKISHDKAETMKDEERLLWLPLEYRPEEHVPEVSSAAES